MRKSFAIWGALFGGLGVMFGALGAHALKKVLEPEVLSSFETGVRYQLVHALLLLILSFQKEMDIKWIGRLLIAGTILFSFSIYLLCLKDLIQVEQLRWLGPITPIGGLLLIGAWVLLAIKGFKSSRTV